MGAGSSSYLLDVAQFGVTVGPRLEGDEVASTLLRDKL